MQWIKFLSHKLTELGYSIVSGGTDTHLILIDLTNKNISGKKAEIALEKAGITTNKNMVPFDKNSPMITSGVRIGTPALTTRGMKEAEMTKIADLINNVIINIDNDIILKRIREEVQELCSAYPLHKEYNHEMSWLQWYYY